MLPDGPIWYSDQYEAVISSSALVIYAIIIISLLVSMLACQKKKELKDGKINEWEDSISLEKHQSGHKRSDERLILIS